MATRQGQVGRTRWFVMAVAACGWPFANAVADDKPKGDVYTLDTCPVSGKKLGAMGDPVVKGYDGREVRFCCDGCPAKFEKDKASYLKKIDDAIVKQQLPRYPLDTCLVSGEAFGGDMGDPVNYVHQNRLVRFCCKSCIKKFGKDAAEHIMKLDRSVIEKQKSAYPLETCVISGDKLDGGHEKPIDRVVGGRLVRLCCKDCIKDLEKDPLTSLQKIDEAAKAKSGQ